MTHHLVMLTFNFELLVTANKSYALPTKKFSDLDNLFLQYYTNELAPENSKRFRKSYFMKKAMYLIATHDMIFDDFVLKTIYFTYTCTLKYHQ